MKMTTTYKDLTTRIINFQKTIEVNNEAIAKRQAENLEFQEKVEAIEKVLKLCGEAWTPKKAMKKVVVKKKAARKPKPAKKRVHSTQKLQYALQKDTTSTVTMREVIDVFTEDFQGKQVPVHDIVLAINARRTSKASRTAVHNKLQRLRKSPHPEVNTLLKSYRIRAKLYEYALDLQAAKKLKPLLLA
jgi:hypothetical protein